MPEQPYSDASRQPIATGTAALRRALPGLLLIALVCLAPLWGVLAASWSVFAVVFVFVADGAFDGVFAWRRARSARGDTGRDDRDAVLVKEFVRTYMVVVTVMALIAYMAFTGKLLKPGGELPPHPYQGFATWELWAIVAALFAVRAFEYWWDWVRGDEGALLPPAAVVSAPLRRLFVLQFGLLIVGLVVYWPLRSSTAGIAALVLLAATANVLLAVTERLRTSSVRAALAAGEKPRGTRGSAAKDGAGNSAATARDDRAPKARPRGGRKRKRK
ncbi:MAG TPA: DUF6498-containing protein [Thermoleophilia bacterium]|nr:DUF6498-containing protein [Thermoleophilia bacterium]